MVTRVKYDLTKDRNSAKYTGRKQKVAQKSNSVKWRIKYRGRSKFWLTVKVSKCVLMIHFNISKGILCTCVGKTLRNSHKDHMS